MNIFFEEDLEKLKNIGILPVVCLKNEDELNTFLKAITKSPVRCIEITLRHPFSLDAITYIKKNFPFLTVGAGTVLSEDILIKAIDAGADFFVSPGSNCNLYSASIQYDIPFLPGCSTPTEFLDAFTKGHEVIKYFPAECSGGIKALKLYEGAFSNVSFIPTGGITLDNFPDYIKCKNVIACGGSFMLPKDMLMSGNSEGIYKVIMNCISICRKERIG